MSRIIAHRGNILGPNERYENTIFAIEKCIAEGFDVEVDVRIDSTLETLYLGHDNYSELIDKKFLKFYTDRLWIHCKTFETLNYFSGSKFNYFWHEDDSYTLTSCGNIWAHPKSFHRSKIIGCPSNLTNTVLVLPETSVGGPIFELPDTVFGVCTDYPYEIKFSK